MKLEILLDIFFQLLSRRKITASYLAEKYSLSQRTVYRYISVLAKALPLSVKRGRDGGVQLSDCYKLPSGFLTDEEYSAALEALSFAYAESLDERYLHAKRKLSSEAKSGRNDSHLLGDAENLFIRDTFSQNLRLADRLRLLEESITQRELIEIVYLGEKKTRTLEPHALIQKEGVWLLYAFCRKERAFRPFAVGQIVAAFKTQEGFSRRQVSLADIPHVVHVGEMLDVRLKLSPNAVKTAQDRFGVDCVRLTGDEYFVDLTLPNSPTLAQDVLSLGAGVEVIFPTKLREEVITLLKETAKAYV